MAQVVIDKDRCEGCGDCVSGCPQGVLALGADGKAEVVNPENCEFCRNCVNDCPLGAVDID